MEFDDTLHSSFFIEFFFYHYNINFLIIENDYSIIRQSKYHRSKKRSNSRRARSIKAIASHPQFTLPSRSIQIDLNKINLADELFFSRLGHPSISCSPLRGIYTRTPGGIPPEVEFRCPFAPCAMLPYGNEVSLRGVVV